MLNDIEKLTDLITPRHRFMTTSFGFALALNSIELTIACACKDWPIKRHFSNLGFVMDSDSKLSIVMILVLGMKFVHNCGLIDGNVRLNDVFFK